jgi:hypothetical protein
VLIIDLVNKIIAKNIRRQALLRKSSTKVSAFLNEQVRGKGTGSVPFLESKQMRPEGLLTLSFNCHFAPLI